MKELYRHEKLGIDYRITYKDRGAAITILAPHGGKIEPQTTLVAEQIADSKLNLFSFEGIKPNGNFDLHVTSHNYDDEDCLSLCARSEMVVAVHGCTNRKAEVLLGGLDTELVRAIKASLEASGISSLCSGHRFPGTNPENICNQGRIRKGVQLELTKDLRQDRARLAIVAQAVKAAL